LRSVPASTMRSPRGSCPSGPSCNEIRDTPGASIPARTSRFRRRSHRYVVAVRRSRNKSNTMWGHRHRPIESRPSVTPRTHDQTSPYCSARRRGSSNRRAVTAPKTMPPM
jgi:hypothetical protein